MLIFHHESGDGQTFAGAQICCAYPGQFRLLSLRARQRMRMRNFKEVQRSPMLVGDRSHRKIQGGL